MGKSNNSLTYVIGLEGGAEEGPLTLADLKPLLREGKVRGGTFIKRSDRTEWTTAADLPELKVRDVVEGKDPWGPDGVTVEICKDLAQRKVRSAVSWLFWIGALSLVNSALAVLGFGSSFAMGLGAAHLIAALGDHFGNSGIWVSLGANIGLSLAFIIVGILAWHGRPWLLGPVLALYVADTVMCGVYELWLSVGLHALALFYLIPGFIASFAARGVEMSWRSWAIPGTAAAILSAASVGGVMFIEKAATPDPAPWAGSAPSKWPQISAANAAEFKGHTHLKAGNAFFIRQRNGHVVAATVQHLLGDAGGVEPDIELEKLSTTINQWNITTRTAPPKSARVRGVHGPVENHAFINDWLLMEVHPDDMAKLPAEPLAPRFTILEEDETVYLVGAGVAGAKQEVHAAKIVKADDLSMTAKFDKPINLVGFSGSPVVDANGSLVGILTSSDGEADKHGKYPTFVADSVIEVSDLLK